jgi:hypothetical protein
MTRFVYSPTQLKLIVPQSVSANSGSSYFVGLTYEFWLTYGLFVLFAYLLNILIHDDDVLFCYFPFGDRYCFLQILSV